MSNNAFAADGVTPIHSPPGYALMVSAVAFNRLHAEVTRLRAALAAPAPQPCPECNDTGERDSGGTHPWGEPIYLACDCKDAEIGRRWRQDSRLEMWFPITAERIAAQDAEIERLRKALSGYSSVADRGPMTEAQISSAWHGIGEVLPAVVAFTRGIRTAEAARGITSAPEGKQP